ncbi:MAG: valine--tRNA ligase [Armatimonadetes bacterium]|nr:valine--tRNA ligase [Armatimonadota bacterium]
MAKDLAKTYNLKEVEPRLYARWEQAGAFAAPVKPGAPRFCITIPPPNVTGELHMGHALQHAIHDLIIRRKRMQGFNTLCLPGTDHASIATQLKVEQQMRSEGLTRWDLGRERFIERAWEWTRKYGGTILRQLRQMGCSYDWSRTRFTLDDAYYRAVLTAFVHFFHKGWIYRGKRVMSWCPECQTVVSDLEVVHKEIASHLWHIRYPTPDGTGGVVVATTRPETMLGDTAVAVHPSDQRYTGIVGRNVLLPLMNREIPVVADHAVDPDFGTGAVKVTPAHDPNDFEIAQRHNLPFVEVIGPNAVMTQEAGRFAGLARFEARHQVVAALQEQGYLLKTEDYTHAVGHHDKCGTMIEPLLTEQWFMRMRDLADLALTAIREERVRFYPERYRAMEIEWLENIRDWCLSRQLWWGQRIPVYTCAACGEMTASVDPPERCRCGDTRLEQDPDVLDTWFSSALWPYATLGWPEKTPELDYFYPTDLMITARDILYLWIARMIMTGEEFMRAEPFRDVLVHATVLTAEGRRMSKSLGTGVDPVELINIYGADVLRFALSSLVSESQDIRFRITWRQDGSAAASDTDTIARAEQCETARNFCTKLWNIARYVLSALGETPPPLLDAPALAQEPLERSDRWILSRYTETVRAVNEAVDRYALGEASWTIYHFVWDEFADWYLELAKPRLREGGPTAETARRVLLSVLEGTLRLAHPFLPFITEEIWQHLPGTQGSLMVTPYPVVAVELRDPDAEERMAIVLEVVRAVRNLRAELGVPAGQPADVALLGDSRLDEQALTYVRQSPNTWARILRERPTGRAVHTLAAGVEIAMPLTGAVDADVEVERARRDLAVVEKDLARCESKLANQQFLARAPEEVVEKERRIRDELVQRREKLAHRIRLFSEA